jgi:hypothetical protein
MGAIWPMIGVDGKGKFWKQKRSNWPAHSMFTHGCQFEAAADARQAAQWTEVVEEEE